MANTAAVRDAGKVRLGGMCKVLPAPTKDTGKVRLGGMCKVLPR